MHMTTFNVHKAKTHLSRLLEDVAAGREVVIAKGGRPAARLVPIEPKRPARKSGFLKGKARISADFDGPLPDRTLKGFEGRR